MNIFMKYYKGHILSQFRISSSLSRVLGDEDTEDAEVAAARPVVPSETADTCFSSVSDTCTCRVQKYPRQVTARSNDIPGVAVLSKSGLNSCNKNFDDNNYFFSQKESPNWHNLRKIYNLHRSLVSFSKHNLFHG